MNTKDLMVRFAKDEDGAALVEYGILVALIAVASIVTIGLLGGTINNFFASVNTRLGAPPA